MPAGVWDSVLGIPRAGLSALGPASSSSIAAVALIPAGVSQPAASKLLELSLISGASCSSDSTRRIAPPSLLDSFLNSAEPTTPTGVAIPRGDDALPPLAATAFAFAPGMSIQTYQLPRCHKKRGCQSIVWALLFSCTWT